MKKIILLFTFIFFASLVIGQNSIYKQKDTKLITSSAVTAGKDSVTYTLQAEWDWSVQILPALGAGCDSIYTSVKIYVSNSDPDDAWTAINMNDTYTSAIDTLTEANIAIGAAWLCTKTAFQHSRIKVLLECLDNTNEDNYYYIYFLAKPTYSWNNR